MTIVPKPYIETPCLRSTPLSNLAGCNIYLKLDNLQPSGSFKSRGIGHFVAHHVHTNPTRPLHFYCSSSGNAGIACATAALSLSRPATITVHSRTSPIMLDKMKALGATMHIAGDSWSDADLYVREVLMPRDPDGVYVPPFDHPLIWAGAESVAREVAKQVPGVIDGVICSVGGGGLFNGIVQGSRQESKSMSGARFLAVETEGADSLAACVREGKFATIDGITSVAASLGAMQVSERTWQLFCEADAHSLVVEDAAAVEACLRFADDERILVEPACGATLAAVYGGGLEGLMRKEGKEWKEHNVVVEICGGNGVSLELLKMWKKEYGL